MPKSRKTNRKIPPLPEAEYEALKGLCFDEQAIARLEKKLRIRISKFDRRDIEIILLTYADSAFNSPDRAKLLLRSELDVKHAIDQLTAVFEAQRQFGVLDPRREGYENFVMYSQRPFSADESNKRTHAMLTGRDPGPVGLCQDEFDQFQGERDESTLTLGKRHGWLEVALREISDKLGCKPLTSTKRGPKGKARHRNFVIFELACVFERCGGKVKAYKDASSGKIEGDFIKFVAAILKACPTSFRKYLGTGIEDAIVKWVQSGRKAPTEGLVRIKLF